jgi:cell wall-associated NlpC family hydrolase
VTRHQSDVLRAAAVAQQRLGQDKLAAAQQLKVLRGLYAAAAAENLRAQAAKAKVTALFNSLAASQKAALLKAQADALGAAKAAAAAVLAQAQAAAAARADATAKARARTGAPAPVQRTTRPKASPKRSTAPKPSGGSTSPGNSSIGARVVAYALAQVGDAYVWGASGPAAFDCSGLTMRAYQRVGISLPHSSSAQWGSGRHISEGSLQPGDLVFYYSPIHHVGIYIGGGMIVHAANPGEGVAIAPLYSMPYDGAVRPY